MVVSKDSIGRQSFVREELTGSRSSKTIDWGFWIYAHEGFSVVAHTESGRATLNREEPDLWTAIRDLEKWAKVFLWARKQKRLNLSIQALIFFGSGGRIWTWLMISRKGRQIQNLFNKTEELATKWLCILASPFPVLYLHDVHSCSLAIDELRTRA